MWLVGKQCENLALEPTKNRDELCAVRFDRGAGHPVPGQLRAGRPAQALGGKVPERQPRPGQAVPWGV